MTSAQPPTGNRIASEVERELQLQLFPLRHVVLAPSEYHIYLHPDDFEHIRHVVPRIVHDVQDCLNALVKRINGRANWSRFVGAGRPPIEIPAGGWAIHINPALNGDVGRGELGIHSRLSVPPQPRYGSGAGTVRVVQTIVSGTDRRVVAERAEPDGPAPAVRGATTGPAPATGARSAVDGAHLSYSDDNGAHVFAITKDLTKIGRGGEDYWVDLTLVTGTKVSREHCHIRRDASGVFFVRDVSAWGTRLNGRPLTKYVEGDPAAQEYELTDGASIQLADAVMMEFRAR
jgi:hypothetical protein